MTKTEAHTILDATKAGASYSSEQIAEALRATGDLPVSTWNKYNRGCAKSLNQQPRPMEEYGIGSDAQSLPDGGLLCLED